MPVVAYATPALPSPPTSTRVSPRTSPRVSVRKRRPAVPGREESPDQKKVRKSARSSMITRSWCEIKPQQIMGSISHGRGCESLEASAVIATPSQSFNDLKMSADLSSTRSSESRVALPYLLTRLTWSVTPPPPPPAGGNPQGRDPFKNAHARCRPGHRSEPSWPPHPAQPARGRAAYRSASRGGPRSGALPRNASSCSFRYRRRSCAPDLPQFGLHGLALSLFNAGS